MMEPTPSNAVEAGAPASNPAAPTAHHSKIAALLSSTSPTSLSPSQSLQSITGGDAAQYEQNVDLSSLFPESPFDAMCLKHVRRLLSSYDECYTKLLIGHAQQQTLLNQQHQQRMQRLKEQQRMKRLRMHELAQQHKQPSHSNDSNKDSDSGNGNGSVDGTDSSTTIASSATGTNDNDSVEFVLLSTDGDSDFVEMKEELELFHRSQLADNTRRFRSQIINLTHRCDSFLSSQLQPQQLLASVTVNLTVTSSLSHRLIVAPLTVHCVETFTDLRRRFVHFMREEEGDAVLAFTPDTQFRIDCTYVNPHCRSQLKGAMEVHHKHSHNRSHGHYGGGEEEMEDHSDDRKSESTFASFMSRATRSRPFTYTTNFTGTHNHSHTSAGSESGASTTQQGSTSQSRPVGGTDSQPSSQTHSLQPSPSSRSSVNAAHSPSSQTQADGPSFTFIPAAQSHNPSQSSAPSTDAGHILIIDENIAVVNFLPDFTTSLDMKMVGSVVLVSDQAPNAVTKKKSRATSVTVVSHPPLHDQTAQASHISSFLPHPAAMAAATGRAFAAMPRQAAKLLPSRLRSQSILHSIKNTTTPPLPKLPPSLTAFFQRHQPNAAEKEAMNGTQATPLPVPLTNSDNSAQVSPAPIGSQSRSTQSSDSSEESLAQREVSVSTVIDYDDDNQSSTQKRTSSASTLRRYPRRFPRSSQQHSTESSMLSRYARLSVDVDHSDANDRIDSIAPSQSFSMDIPFIDYDEDDDGNEVSVTHSARSSALERDDLQSLLMLGDEPVDGELLIDNDVILMTGNDEDNENVLLRGVSTSDRHPIDTDEHDGDMMNALIHSQSFSHISLDSTPSTQSVAAPPSHLRQHSMTSPFDIGHLLVSTPSLTAVGGMASLGHPPPLPTSTPPPLRFMAASPVFSVSSPPVALVSPLVSAAQGASPSDSHFLTKQSHAPHPHHRTSTPHGHRRKASHTRTSQ